MFKRLFLISGILCFMLFFPVYAERFELSSGFCYEDIPQEIQKLMNGKSYIENKYIRFDDLKLCKVLHMGFDGKEHEGKLIVAHKAITPTGETVNVAKEVLEIFRELYEAKYPIEKITLIDNYDANDEKSMLDNNSSAFVFRYIKGTDRISWHSYGLAIDINPFVNPCYHKKDNTIEPAGTEKFLDRTLNQQGLIKENDICYNVFKKRGWEWGGEWDSLKDYMHFQKFSWRTPRPEKKY